MSNFTMSINHAYIGLHVLKTIMSSYYEQVCVGFLDHQRRLNLPELTVVRSSAWSIPRPKRFQLKKFLNSIPCSFVQNHMVIFLRYLIVEHSMNTWVHCLAYFSVCACIYRVDEIPSLNPKPYIYSCIYIHILYNFSYIRVLISELPHTSFRFPVKSRNLAYGENPFPPPPFIA